MQLEIADHFQLLALHRCLLEAKFSEDPNDKDIAGSPLVADLARRVVRKLEEHPEAGDWESWLRLDPSRREWKIALDTAVKDKAYWGDLGMTAREAYVEDLLAPFRLSSDSRDDFMSAAGMT